MAQTEQKYSGDTEHSDESIINEYTESQLDEIAHATQYQQTWTKIASCVSHEMYGKLSSAIKSIVNNHKYDIGLYDIDNKHIDKMIDILKTKRNLGIEERVYLKKLCKRAKQFKPESISIIQHQHGIFYLPIVWLQTTLYNINNQSMTELIQQGIFIIFIQD